jgi:thiosulfate reductase cytochrome b subunit
MILTGQSGWGRSLHFLSAWVLVLCGLVYVVVGLWRGHFRTRFWPTRSQLDLPSMTRTLAMHLHVRSPRIQELHDYNIIQKLVYLTVVFGLFPSMIWTGFAMSPAITSVVAGIVTTLGGQQSARTLHFVGACALMVFVVVHIGMVWLNGFRSNVRAMIVGRSSPRKGHL